MGRGRRRGTRWAGKLSPVSTWEGLVNAKGRIRLPAPAVGVSRAVLVSPPLSAALSSHV